MDQKAEAVRCGGVRSAGDVSRETAVRISIRALRALLDHRGEASEAAVKQAVRRPHRHPHPPGISNAGRRPHTDGRARGEAVRCGGVRSAGDVSRETAVRISIRALRALLDHRGEASEAAVKQAVRRPHRHPHPPGISNAGRRPHTDGRAGGAAECRDDPPKASDLDTRPAGATRSTGRSVLPRYAPPASLSIRDGPVSDDVSARSRG